MNYKQPGEFRRMLAKKLETMAADLSYNPAPGECVIVEPDLFRELLDNAELVAEYQSIYEAMPSMTDTSTRSDCEKNLQRLQKKLADELR